MISNLESLSSARAKINNAIANSQTALDILAVTNGGLYGAGGDSFFLVDKYPQGDFADRLRAAIADAQGAGGGLVRLNPRQTHTLTSRVDLPVGRISYDFGSCVIAASSVPDGDLSAFSIIPDTLDTVTNATWVRDLYLVGPESESRTLDGITLGRPLSMGGGNTAHLALHHLKIRGFRDNFVLGNQSWVNKFINFQSTHAWRRGFSLVGDINAGENISFFGGSINDCKNAAGDARGFYSDVSGNADAFFFGFSLVYNNVLMELNTGNVALHGCHLEDNSDNPQIIINYTAGVEPVAFTSSGSSYSVGPFTSALAVETAEGRPAFITITGSRSSAIITGGKWARFGKSQGEFVKVLANAPTVRVSGVDFQPDVDKVPSISDTTNLIVNGGFELAYDSPYFGWKPNRQSNFIRNGALVGAVAGSPGTLPTGWVVLGLLNGLTRILSIEYSNGIPVLIYRLTGTPSADGTVGVRFDGNTAIPNALNNEWVASYGAYARGALTGVTAGIGVEHYNGAGTRLTADSSNISPSGSRQVFTQFGKATDAATTFVAPSFYLAYTNGVAVDCTIVLDSPCLQLIGSSAEGVIGNNAAAALPPATRWYLDTTVNTGSRSLRFDCPSAETLELFQDLTVTGGDSLAVRGYINVSGYGAGAAELAVRFLDVTGREINRQRAGSQVVANTAYKQIGFMLRVPTGAVTARVGCSVSAFIGTARFDDLAAWVI